MQSPTLALAPASAHWTRTHFGAAHLAKSLVWSSVDLLLGYYLYSVLHLPAPEVARLLFIFLIFGAACDALLGIAITASRMRRESVLFLHLIGALGTACALFAQFTWTRHSPELILAAGLIFRFAFALYDVPQTALTSLLPADDHDARGYVRLRATLSSVARLGVTTANLGFAHLPAALFRAGGVAVLVGLSALMLITSWSLLSTAKREQTPAQTAPRSRITLPQGLVSVLFAFLASTTLFATLSRMLIFSPSPAGFAHLGAWLLLAFGMGNVLGPFMSTRLVDAAGWRRACIAASIVAVVAGDLLLLMPHTASPLTQIGAAAMYGLGLGAVGTYLWETASRVVRQHAAATGERSDGLVFGLVIFTIQISIALGSLILGAVLDDHVRDGIFSALTTVMVTTLGGLVVTALLIRKRTPVAVA